MDMNSDSPFPTEDFDTFTDYYREKYNIVLERPELPLLEAYLINTKVNGLLPRARSHKMRREEKMEDFREHMVPELCRPLSFPAVYWLKLSSLPSVLHRLSRILLVEELRRKILYEAGAGSSEIKYSRLTVDPSCIENQDVSIVPPSKVKRGLAIGNVKLENRKKITELRKPWNGNQEPVDMLRHMESWNYVEIRYFDEFLAKSLSSPEPQPEFASSPMDEEGSESDSDSISCENEKSLSLLRSSVSECYGPQQHELLEVFTSSSSRDGVNMDRIQLLGNAFLNLSISVYGYQYGLNSCGSRTSACLHKLQSDFMSRTHLKNCSMKKGLCNRMKVSEFNHSDWIPPSFTTPLMLKQVLKGEEISPNVLDKIFLTEDEQLSGIIDADSEEVILETLTEFVNFSTSQRNEMYIDRQRIQLQSAASCVEALVGTYFKNCGWQGALKVIGWLELLPPNPSLLDCEATRVKESLPSQWVDVPVSLESLQGTLSYSFNDKNLLVQAVTHESYVSPYVQGYMDTLAFLGSSILDFLLTCYIFEHFVELNPPKLWRIREILSSSSTLAYFAVRHNFHKYLLSNSVSLLNSIDRFVKHQKGCQQLIDDELQLLLEEHECDSPYQVEVPNALAKLLPSLIGAVYLDSGKNLQVVWELFSDIFLPELGAWRQTLPLSIVDLLKDLSPAAHQVIFSEEKNEQNKIEVKCKILMDNTREEVFVACGSDAAKTKNHAAKLAIRNLLGKTSVSY